jgi:catechol 2,3-dioxygenase-like lactoylglutathione lyase family enzyme
VTTLDFVLLYVDSPAASADFYAGLLGRSPVESSPTFAMFVLPSGMRLGLWSRHTVEPSPSSVGGACELGFQVANPAAVKATYADWQKRGLRIIQQPTDMDFGHTFVALDPDGHRLRVYAMAEG